MRRKRTLKIIILYYIIMLILFCVVYTFSKYVSTAQLSIKTNIAPFRFKIGQNSDTIELDLKDTLLTGNAFSDTQIIPGTKGKIILQLDFSDVEVASNYTISIDTEQTKMPNNMKLYTDENNQVSFSLYRETVELGEQIKEREIYWTWEYTTADETQEWMNKEIKIFFNIQVEQTCLIAFSGQTLLQIPQNTHLDKSTSMLLFSLSTVDVGMFLTVIASTGHNSAQKPQ